MSVEGKETVYRLGNGCQFLGGDEMYKLTLIFNNTLKKKFCIIL